MPRLKQGRPPAEGLDKLDRAILQHVHAWGVAAARPLASIIGINYQRCTWRLRRLKRLRFIEAMGFPCIRPTEREFLRYYRPTFKTAPATAEFISRGHHPRFDSPSHFPLRKKVFLPGHMVTTLIAAEWIAYAARVWGLKPIIIPEFILRYGRGWYGGGKAPRHPSPVLTMVPDFLLEVEGVVIHFEVELSPKHGSLYDRNLIRLRPPNRPVIFIVPDERFAINLRQKLPPARKNVSIVILGDDKGLKASLAARIPTLG